MAKPIQISNQGIDIPRSVLGSSIDGDIERYDEYGDRFVLSLTKGEQMWFKKNTGKIFE